MHPWDPTCQISPGLDTTVVSLLNVIKELLEHRKARMDQTHTVAGSPLHFFKIFPQSILKTSVL